MIENLAFSQKFPSICWSTAGFGTRAQTLMAEGEIVCLDFLGLSIEDVLFEGSGACSDLTATEHVEPHAVSPQGSFNRPVNESA